MRKNSSFQVDCTISTTLKICRVCLLILLLRGQDAPAGLIWDRLQVDVEPDSKVKHGWRRRFRSLTTDSYRLRLNRSTPPVAAPPRPWTKIRTRSGREGPHSHYLRDRAIARAAGQNCSRENSRRVRANNSNVGSFDFRAYHSCPAAGFLGTRRGENHKNNCDDRARRQSN